MSGLRLLSSYPKSGNTWLRALLTALKHPSPEEQVGLNLDFPNLFQIASFEDHMGVDLESLLPDDIDLSKPEYCRSMAAEAFLDNIWKVHDAAFLSPSDRRPTFPMDAIESVVYLVRDPRDVAVSYAHHAGVSLDRCIEFMGNTHATLSFKDGQYYDKLPQFQSDWSGHVTGWLDHSGLKVHVARYEDMLSNPFDSFATILRHLSIDHDSVSLNHAIEACRFERLQAREKSQGFNERPTVASQAFFRQGIAGGWRTVLTEAQVKRIEGRHGAVMQRLGYL